MKKMTVSMAAALTLGVLVAPAAQADTVPVYDPGSATGSKFELFPDRNDDAGDAVVRGKFVEYSVSLDYRTSVRDYKDDGLDVYLWVQYGKRNDYTYKEAIASASGAGKTTTIMSPWYSPVGMHVDFFAAKVCLGPGEVNCGPWAG